jgi:hypothetical protein
VTQRLSGALRRDNWKRELLVVGIETYPEHHLFAFDALSKQSVPEGRCLVRWLHVKVL